MTKPTLAVWKFAFCDGCQLSILDCEDELLLLADEVDISYFLEASSTTVEGPYDLSIIEGSMTTAHDVERIHEIRAQSRFLVPIGACATAGGIQALRNFDRRRGLHVGGLREPPATSTRSRRRRRSSTMSRWTSSSRAARRTRSS